MTRIYFIQKWLLVILLFGSALAFNPWINTEVFEFPKLLVLLFSVSLLAITVIIDLHFQDLSVLKKSLTLTQGSGIKKFLPEIIAFVGLLMSQIIAYAFSTDQETSLIGAPNRYQGFLTQLHYLLLLFSVVCFYIRYPKEKTEKLFFWLLIALFLACLFAISPYAFPLTNPFYIFTPEFFYDRVFGTFGNPNYLAVYLAALLPLLFFAKKKTSITFFGTFKNFPQQFLIALVLLTLFLTGSRSAWAASIAGFLIMGIFVVIKNKKYKTLIITLSAIFGILILFATKQWLSTSVPQLNRLSLDTNQSTSIQTRLSLWKTGIKMSFDRPFTGYGQDMIQANIEPYLSDYLKANDVFFVDRTHSEFTDVLLTTGYIGLISYLILIITIIIKSFKYLFCQDHEINNNFTACLTGFLILTIFHAVNFSTLSSNVLFYFISGYLIANYMLKS